ncbi:alpha/beta hydrolase [Streptomyces sp. RS10V-4]|uniref:alpha/beta fold hydrolase n=1 Tax=Streptomyces rhizoryzae TaxID=2932493 RepID=UPI00200399A2|nr:alpha/beta hydrolase [Streptomyces rhizoryzae]MCK7622890.1 alpha/beta hydrolase [Streptomyces rhizoryzae]
MVRRSEVTGSGGVRLAAWEFAEGPERGGGPEEGGRRPGVLLLHGLMGCASHWAATARRLATAHRAVALDQRGHGRSEQLAAGPPARTAYADDAIAAIEQLELAPAALVGHGMGALTAWQVAARRPDLVSALVICDMRASPLGAASQRAWAEWLSSWPVPFATLADVRTWFGEGDPALERPRPERGAFFAEVMAERSDGWRPVFSRRRILGVRETWVHDAHWDELAQVTCPALVVRGLDAELGRAEAQEMVRVLPRGAYAEIPDAGHLLPWEQPEAWYRAIEPFLHAVAARS